jgi:hypothetical protein
MKSFDYVRPETVRDAVTAAAEHGAVYLAAGTNLLDLMKGGVTAPNRLVDISHLSGLDRIEELPDGGLRIGALVRNADLATIVISRSAFRRSPRRFCLAPPRSFAMPQPSAATSCSERAARTFTIPQQPATNAIPAPAATPTAATTGFMPYWAGARTASRRIRPISAFRWLRSTRLSSSKAERAVGKHRSRCFIGCPARGLTARPC